MAEIQRCVVLPPLQLQPTHGGIFPVREVRGWDAPRGGHLLFASPGHSQPYFILLCTFGT